MAEVTVRVLLRAIDEIVRYLGKALSRSTELNALEGAVRNLEQALSQDEKSMVVQLERGRGIGDIGCNIS